MKLCARILISLSLLSFAGCSGKSERPDPEIRIVKQTEKAVPPDGLIKQCTGAAETDIVVTRDLLANRDAWKSAFCRCAAQHNRLIQWNVDKAPEMIAACKGDL